MRWRPLGVLSFMLGFVWSSCGGKSGETIGSTAAADACAAYCAAVTAKNCPLPVYGTLDECKAEECAMLGGAPANCQGALKAYYECEASQRDICADDGCGGQLLTILACTGRGGGRMATGGRGGSEAGGAPGDAGAADSGQSSGHCNSVAQDFSRAGMNPNGPWSYGWSSRLDSTFTIFKKFSSKLGDLMDSEGGAYWTDGVSINPTALLNATNRIFHTGGSYTLAPEQFALHPGPNGEYAVARWSVSRSGRYTVRAEFSGLSGYGGSPVTTTDVHVRHNGVDVASGFLNINGATNSFTFNGDVTVAGGDTIDFAVGYGNGMYAFDSTGLEAVICEP